MGGLDWALVGLTIVIVLGGLLALLLVWVAVRRALTILGAGYVSKHKNKTLAKFSLVFIIIGLVAGLVLLLSDVRNKPHTAHAYDTYFFWTIFVVSTVTGVVLTFFIRLPR